VDDKGIGWRVAYCLIDVPKETTEVVIAFLLVIKKRINKWKPRVLKSDCDFAYLQASRRLWPECRIIWCTVSKNNFTKASTSYSAYFLPSMPVARVKKFEEESNESCRRRRSQGIAAC